MDSNSVRFIVDGPNVIDVLSLTLLLKSLVTMACQIETFYLFIFIFFMRKMKLEDTWSIYVHMNLWVRYLSRDMRFPTMWFVWPAKPQISLRLRAVWSEPLLVAWIFYEC